MQNNKFTTKDLCLTAIFTAFIAILAQISIPMPLGIPLTMQTFAILLTGILLGPKRGAISALVYLLLGAIGIPVFHAFTGGFHCIAGPTGGFILSFPLMALFAGLGAKYWPTKKYILPLCLVLALGSNYFCGVLLYSLITGSTLAVGFAACVLPFLAADCIKTLLAAGFGILLKKRLKFL